MLPTEAHPREQPCSTPSLGAHRDPWAHTEPRGSGFCVLIPCCSPGASAGSTGFWQGLGAEPCSEVFAPGGSQRWQIRVVYVAMIPQPNQEHSYIPCSVSKNSCITHLAMKCCKTQLTLPVLVSRDSLWPYPESIPACAAHAGSIGEKWMHGHKKCVLGSWQSFLGMSGFRGGVIWPPQRRSPRHPAGAAGF